MGRRLAWTEFQVEGPQGFEVAKGWHVQGSERSPVGLGSEKRGVGLEAGEEEEIRAF